VAICGGGAPRGGLLAPLLLTRGPGTMYTFCNKVFRTHPQSTFPPFSSLLLSRNSPTLVYGRMADATADEGRPRQQGVAAVSSPHPVLLQIGGWSILSLKLPDRTFKKGRRGAVDARGGVPVARKDAEEGRAGSVEGGGPCCAIHSGPVLISPRQAW